MDFVPLIVILGDKQQCQISIPYTGLFPSLYFVTRSIRIVTGDSIKSLV